MKRKVIMNIFLIVLIGIFIYSGYNVFIWIKSDIETRKIENKLYSEVVHIDELGGNNDQNIFIDFNKLKAINSDVIGWIKIDNTNINYPILQGTTDEFYLRKDIYKKYNISGSIFVYSNVNKQFLDENTVIYGHNMKNKKMFADINKIYNGELGKNIDVLIFTEENHTTYKVFSCYMDKPNREIIKNFFTKNEKEKYINDAIRKSIIDFNQQINYNNKIITLITCGSTNKERIIVHAIKNS